MKRISLVALSATAAMAQVPATTAAAVAAPVAATPVSYSGSAAAPLAPIHDDLIMGNPALPKSLGYLLVIPSDYYGKREAAFQWNGGNTTTFNGAGLAVIDQFFTGFDVNGGQGQLAAGYVDQAFGVGLRVNLDQTGFAADSANRPVGVKEADSTLAPTSFGLFGSAPVGDLTVYGHLDWGTPVGHASYVFQVGNTTQDHSSRSDALSLGFGVSTPALGDAGLSWDAGLDLVYSNYRPMGVNADDSYTWYNLTQTASIGKSFSSQGFVLAAGLNEVFDYSNALGGDWQGYSPNHNLNTYSDSSDWNYSIALVPTLSTVLPVFEHWTVKGGAGLPLVYQRQDVLAGDDQIVYSRLWSATPVAVVGVRYERGRWAAEAALDNGFLNRGPYFVSGSDGDMFASFAVTANFK